MEYKKIMDLVEIALGVVSDNTGDICDFGFHNTGVAYLSTKREMEEEFKGYFEKLERNEEN